MSGMKHPHLKTTLLTLLVAYVMLLLGNAFDWGVVFYLFWILLTAILVAWFLGSAGRCWWQAHFGDSTSHAPEKANGDAAVESKDAD